MVADLDNSIIDENIVEDNDLLRFKEVKNSDHLVVPLQCDCCHFQNIHRRMSFEYCHQNQLLILCFLRVIFDSI